MPRCFAWILTALACFGGAMNTRGSEADPLRLVATVDRAVLTQIAVEKDRIVSRVGASNLPVPEIAEWRLTGDLRAHADLFLFSPEYEIINRLSIADPDPVAVLRHAVVRPRRRSCWTDAELKGGVLVFVWILERKPVAIVPVPAFDPKGAASEFAAVATIPLTAATAQGAPVVLLFKDGHFIPPRPWFRNGTANAALAAMHFGWADEAGTIVAGMRDPDESAESKELRSKTRSAIKILATTTQGEVAPVITDKPATLLQFAAEGGFADVVSKLFALGAQADQEDDDAWGPMHAAASNGRNEVVRLLLAHRPAGKRKRPEHIRPLDVAMSNGHATVASLLVSTTSVADFANVARLAVAFGDETAIRQLAGNGGGITISGLPEGQLARHVQRGDPLVVQALLDAGMPANATVGDTPMLFLAAASGNVECVNVLLRTGAIADGRAAGGITPLMTAVTMGNAPIAKALLTAGADVDATDANGRTALHYAVLAAKGELLSLLVEHRARDLADTEGHTPLHLALAMQARSMVDVLVAHGARLTAADAANHATILQAIAVDSPTLLAQAVEGGWDPNARFFDRWPATQIAAIDEAERCIAWLGSRVTPGTQTRVDIVNGDTAPVAIGGENPAERRMADEFHPADAVRIAGVVSPTGEFLFPRIVECQDARTGSAVLDAASTWRFRPATKQGAAVAARVALVIPFPARDRRIHARANLDVAPEPVRIAPANPDEVSTRTDNEVKAVTTPVWTPQIGAAGGGVMVDRTVLQLYPEYTVVTPTNHWAVVTCVVEIDGKPGSIQVIGAISATYAAAVESAIRDSRFTPGTIAGRAVRARITLTFPVEKL